MANEAKPPFSDEELARRYAAISAIWRHAALLCGADILDDDEIPSTEYLESLAGQLQLVIN